MFDKEIFLSRIKSKAEKAGLSDIVSKELAEFEKYDQIEYLNILERFIKTLGEIGVPCTLLRMAGGTSTVAYLLGLHKINPIKYNLSSRSFFERSYEGGGVGPRFDISIPRSKREEAITALDKIAKINFKTSYGAYFYFGKNDKYRVGLYFSDYLDRLAKVSTKWCSEDFDHLQETSSGNDVIKYMLSEDDKGFCMPHLTGCVLGTPSDFYELMEAGKPKDLYDLAKIDCLMYGLFKSKKKLLKSLKENGLDGTVYSREQLYDLLVNHYEIGESDAFQIVKDVCLGNKLTEWEELTLKSHEVPDYIVSQLANIRHLGYMSFSMQEIYVAYRLAEFKMHHDDEFEKLLSIPYKHSFVGPFFYINGKLHFFDDLVSCFKADMRFFDSSISHFSYFKKLGLEGDYGNYPRGRVIFDNFHKKFIVYLDKDLMKEDIKDEIVRAYRLEKGQTVFKRDSHYTHNDYA